MGSIRQRQRVPKISKTLFTRIYTILTYHRWAENARMVQGVSGQQVAGEQVGTVQERVAVGALVGM